MIIPDQWKIPAKKRQQGSSEEHFRRECFENRIIPIIGSIDDDFTQHVIWPFARMQNDGNQPIRLFINSPGGGVAEMFQFISMIRNSQVPVIADAVYACSAAFMIMTQCHDRIGYPGALYMHHLASMFVWGNRKEIENQSAYLEYADKICDEYLLERTKMSEEQLEQHHDQDWYMNAKQALRLGAIDRIQDEAYLIEPEIYHKQVKIQERAIKKIREV